MNTILFALSLIMPAMIILGVFIIVYILPFVIGIKILRSNRLTKNSILVPGSILSFEEEAKEEEVSLNGHTAMIPKHKHEMFYFPIVKFEFNGEEYQITSRIGKPTPPEIGRTVPIRINPQNISESDIYTKDLSKVGWFLIGLGIFVWVLSIFSTVHF